MVRSAFILLTLLAASTLGCDTQWLEQQSQWLEQQKPSHHPSVSGKVLDDNSEPVANAKILFLPAIKQKVSKKHLPYAFATTNQHGRFTMRIAEEEYGAYTGANLVIISTQVDKATEVDVETNNGPPKEDGLKIIAADKSNEPSDPNVKVPPKESEKQGNAKKKKKTTRTVVTPETAPEKYNIQSKEMVVVTDEGISGLVFKLKTESKTKLTDTPAAAKKQTPDDQ